MIDAVEHAPQECPRNFCKKWRLKKSVFFLRVFTTKKVNIFLNLFLSDFQESQICLDRQVASSHGGVLGPLVNRWKLSFQVDDLLNVFLRIILRDLILTHFWSDFQESLIQPASFYVGFSQVFLAFLQKCMWFYEKNVTKIAKTANLQSRFAVACRKTTNSLSTFAFSWMMRSSTHPKNASGIPTKN